MFPIMVKNDRYRGQRYRDNVIGNTVKMTVIGDNVKENILIRVYYNIRPL